ncbi:MAG: hypothetical protein NTX53_07120 [candidate division WOR-3 bacterium]|nr:hypothetical protein [candidate division WOR-3 bacterium]
MLDSFSAIAVQVQSSKRYTGAELVEVIRGIEATLSSRDRPGSDPNLTAGCSILASIRQRGASAVSDRDSVEAGRAIGRLGSFASTYLSDSTAFALLQSLGNDRSATFDLGLAALGTDRFFIALAALSQLESLEERDRNLVAGKSYELLGLLAHFWAKGGSSRKRAEAFMDLSADSFEPSFGECVRAAQSYHYQVALYATSDRLEELLARVRKGTQ